jgi:D-amino peptidase
MTLDTNAAIAGAFEGGADEVVVEENHGVEELCNLLMDEIDERVSVVRGAGRPGATTMARLDSSIGLVLLVGHHARAGSRPGIMAHTISYERFRSVKLNGADCGEPELFALRAGELGVPVGMLAGDQVAIEQLAKRAPWIERAQVKTALSNVSGEVIAPARARGRIFECAKRAVERARRGDLPVVAPEAKPYEIEVELREAACDVMRGNLAQLPEFTLLGERSVATQAADIEQAFRRIAYLGFANLPGVVRY